MLIGTTYSHREIAYLKLDNTQAFSELLDLSFDIIRLACYWDEIQPEKNTWDFSIIKQLLDRCEEKGQKVVMTIGMKAPRWPEYYLPSWLDRRSPESLSSEVSIFLKKCIKELTRYSCITHWQVENEPCAVSGPNKFSIPQDILQKEVALVRALDPQRKIILTAWGEDIKTIPQIEIADIVGLDLYYKMPINRFFYTGMDALHPQFTHLIQTSHKRIWIMELQAEPWEKHSSHKFGIHPRSMNASLLQKNFQKAYALSPEAILLWGYEYWYLRKKRGDITLWNAVKQIRSDIL